jgi:hypothetical protein
VALLAGMSFGHDADSRVWISAGVRKSQGSLGSARVRTQESGLNGRSEGGWGSHESLPEEVRRSNCPRRYSSPKACKEKERE